MPEPGMKRLSKFTGWSHFIALAVGWLTAAVGAAILLAWIARIAGLAQLRDFS
jgi:hypothetical protein